MIGICYFNCSAPSDPWDWFIYSHPSSLVSAHIGKLPILIRFNDTGPQPTRASWFHVAWILEYCAIEEQKICFTCWTRHGSLWIKHDIEIRRTIFFDLFDLQERTRKNVSHLDFCLQFFLELHCCNHPPWEASVKRWFHSPSETGQDLVFMPVGSIFPAKRFSCFASPKNSDYHHVFGVG